MARNILSWRIALFDVYRRVCVKREKYVKCMWLELVRPIRYHVNFSRLLLDVDCIFVLRIYTGGQNLVRIEIPIFSADALGGVMETNKVAKLLVKALEAEGVDNVYGMPGSHILSVYDALADSSIKYIGAAHEATSGFMAGMHGYLTGRPGVCVLTAGPAATNSITAVAAAMASSLPVVHITADVPSKAKNEPFHGVDRRDFLHRMFKDITKMSVRVERAEDINAIVSKAFQVACSGRPGPVHIDIPIDILSQNASGIAPYVSKKPDTTSASKVFLDSLVESLRSAKKPVICVGRGVLVQDAVSLLLTLAERIEAPVLSTSYALGAFDQLHPLALGTFSEFSKNDFAFGLIKDSDFLLMVGMRPHTQMLDLLKSVSTNAALIALDELDADLSTSWPTKAEAGNCKTSLEYLLSKLDNVASLCAKTRGARGAISIQNSHFNVGLSQTLNQAKNTSPIHFGVVMAALKKQLGPESIVVSGVGNHHVWSRTVLPIRNKNSFIAEAAWGTMAGELGGAIAAKLTFPERPVVCITGDASLLMLAGDFVTAVSEGANILIVVLNDSGHGIIGQMQRTMYGRAYGDRLHSVDFSAFARSMGGVGIRLDSPKEIDSAIKMAIDASDHSPVLLDVVCESNIPWPKRDELVDMGRAHLGVEAVYPEEDLV